MACLTPACMLLVGWCHNRAGLMLLVLQWGDTPVNANMLSCVCIVGGVWPLHIPRPGCFGRVLLSHVLSLAQVSCLMLLRGCPAFPAAAAAAAWAAFTTGLSWPVHVAPGVLRSVHVRIADQ